MARVRAPRLRPARARDQDRGDAPSFDVPARQRRGDQIVGRARMAIERLAGLRRRHPALGAPAREPRRPHRRALHHRRLLGAGGAGGHGHLRAHARGEPTRSTCCASRRGTSRSSPGCGTARASSPALPNAFDHDGRGWHDSAARRPSRGRIASRRARSRSRAGSRSSSPVRSSSASRGTWRPTTPIVTIDARVADWLHRHARSRR